MRFDFWRPCYFYRVKPTKGRKVNGGHGSYLVNWRSLASMLRCLMHILVSAEPMSLVAPGNTKKARFIGWNTHTHTHTHTQTYCTVQPDATKEADYTFTKETTQSCDEYLHYCSEWAVQSQSIVFFKQMNLYQAFVSFYNEPVFTQETDLPLVDTLHTPASPK